MNTTQYPVNIQDKVKDKESWYKSYTDLNYFKLL